MRAILVLSINIAILATGQPSGATWYVDDSAPSSGNGTWARPFKTIQEGIDASSHRDMVIVAEGTYVENIRFNGKNIMLRSTESLNPTVVANTVIDGNSAGSVVRFNGTENETCLLSGFTIRNGTPGIWGNEPGVADCTHATIQNNVITRNAGGVSYCDGAIRNNVISGNESYEGGGLYDCDGPILSNVISGNVAFYDDGGGLYDCDGLIANNTVVGNCAAGTGGGLYFCDGPILNCIVWGNRATMSPQIHMEGGADPRPFVFHSCVEGWSDGDGNIGADPVFVTPGQWDDMNTQDVWDDVWMEGDYRLRPDSPCIDAGTNEDWMVAATDLDGKPRILRGRSSPTVDMGAYERSWFRISHVRMGGTDGLQLTWNSRAGSAYVIWSCTDLPSGDWTLEWAVSSAGDSTSWTDFNTRRSRKFYRVEQF